MSSKYIFFNFEKVYKTNLHQRKNCLKKEIIYELWSLSNRLVCDAIQLDLVFTVIFGK